MTSPLKRAQRGLQFEDLFQRAADCWLANDFEPRTPAPEFRMQIKHLVVQSDLLSFRDDGGDDTSSIHLFRVRIDTGVRLVNCGENEHSEEISPCAQIEASYQVDYRITDQSLISDQEALDAFALENASYHLWPYWREYAMSQAQRMNLPKIPIPLQMTKQTATSESSEK